MPYYSGSGSNTPTGGTAQPFTIPITNTEPINITYGSGTTTATITITYYWMHADPNNPGADPAPQYIDILETGSGNWSAITPLNASAPSGTGSDGLGNSEVDTNSPIGTPPQSTQYQGASSGVRAKHLTVTSAKATDTITLTASCTDPYATGQGLSLSAAMAPRAVPVNFTQTSGTANADGSLSFMYSWQSSSGNLDDLTNYYVHEYVTYTNDPTGALFAFPAPFTVSWFDPTISPGPVNMANAISGKFLNPDTQTVPASAAPFASVTVPATQLFEYDDLNSGVKNIGFGGPYTITRAVGNPHIPFTGIWYSCTKNGVTGWHQLQ